MARVGLPRLVAMVVLGTTMALSAACGAGAKGPLETAATTAVGKPAPNFVLSTPQGENVQLSRFKGKAVLVNFWATWCPPCREEMPLIEAYYRENRARGFEAIGIDILEDARTVERYVNDAGYTWTFLIDEQGETIRSFNVVAAPTTFFIDKEGVIRDVHVGGMTKDTLLSKLSKIAFDADLSDDRSALSRRE